MDSKSKNILKGSLLAGSIVGLTGISANATVISSETLGSGAEVRATLLQSERVINNAIELKCGEEAKKSEAKEETKKTKESKAEEHKCGEGKCGEGEKKETKAEAKKESKAEEHKCGEGKCGL